MPNGRLPVLELSNGQRLSESHAIMRFLGRKFGLAGSTELEQLRTDEVADLHKDFSNEIKQYFYTASGFRQGDQAELLDSVFLPAAGRYFGQLQQLLERNAAQLPFFKKPPSGGPFLTGVMPTFADFLVSLFPILFGGFIPAFFRLQTIFTRCAACTRPFSSASPR
jgi:glutathione S-transferase